MVQNLTLDKNMDKNCKYNLEFDIQELNLLDENYCDLSVLLCFNGNLMKFPLTDETGGIMKETQLFKFYCTPIELAKTLKTNLVVYKFSRGQDDIGSGKQIINESFSKAVTCPEFQSLKDKKIVIIRKTKQAIGSFTVQLTIEKLSDSLEDEFENIDESVSGDIKSDLSTTPSVLLTSIRKFCSIGSEMDSIMRQKSGEHQVQKNKHPCRPSKRVEWDRKRFIQQLKRKTRGKYLYCFGKMRPIRLIDHEKCLEVVPDLVPKNMGWQWDLPPIGVSMDRSYWKPGAVKYSVRKLMNHFLNPYPYDTIPLSKRDETGKLLDCFENIDEELEFDHQTVEQFPTLQIKKKHGECFITMNPLKDSNQLKYSCDPYLKCSPILFKISKNDENKLFKIKRMLKERGLTFKCCCKDQKKCDCMTKREMAFWNKELMTISKELKLKDPLKLVDLIDVTSESELDVEFTTPAAIVDHFKRPKDVVHIETQYDINDFAMKKSDVKKDLNPKKGLLRRTIPGNLKNNAKTKNPTQKPKSPKPKTPPQKPKSPVQKPKTQPQKPKNSPQNPKAQTQKFNKKN